MSRDSEIGSMARLEEQDLKVEEVDELWKGDTGASSHMCKVWKGYSKVIQDELERQGFEMYLSAVGYHILMSFHKKMSCLKMPSSIFKHKIGDILLEKVISENVDIENQVPNVRR